MKKENTNKENTNTPKKSKKVLDGIDTNIEIKNKEIENSNKSQNKQKNNENKKKNETKESKNLNLKKGTTKGKNQKKKSKTNDINDKIQSVVSILFTIVIFIALLFLIFVLYNNYLKPEEKLDLNKVCQDFFPKDYHITSEMIDNFIKNARPVIYNFENFDRKKLNNTEMLKFATYFIWGANTDYIVCDEEDKKCLVSKMEMPLKTLKEYFHNYLDIDNLDLQFNTDFKEDDETRLYEEDDKLVLTFSEFTYQSLRHNLTYTNIDEDKVTIVFALEKLINDSNIYEYAGYKTIELKYKNNNFIIEKIETSLK